MSIRFTARASALRRRTGVSVLAIAALTTSLLAPGSGLGSASAVTARPVTAPTGVGGATVPELTWRGCGRHAPEGLRCAKVQVPLDYDRPQGATTTLALAKLPAADRSARIGSLFVNPGGPGGEARGFVPFAADLIGPVARSRFDVIGIDPRGIGLSTPVHCTLVDPEFPPFAFPFNRNQVRTQLRYGAALRKGCADSGNAILDHMSTADTARDMELIRQAVGDPQLSYYGISYGSYLGATYAAMFPDNVRALIVDGVLDPVAWSTGRGDSGSKLPFSTRIGSGLGAAETLSAALTRCNEVGRQRCALAPNAHAKWNRIDDRLRRGPAMVDGRRLRYSDLVSYTLSAMYSAGSYKILMRDLAGLHRDLFNTQSPKGGKSTVDSLRELAERAQADRPGPWSPSPGPAAAASADRIPVQPGFEGVACSDTVNPTDPRAWTKAAVFDDKRGAGGFGRLWTWISSVCADWPGSDADAFRGPWDVDTSTPVLIVGNSHDPATPVTGAVALHEVMDTSRLVTLRAWGHGALGASKCVTRIFNRYLANQVLPASDVSCQPNRPLYPAAR
jgi:pimeloyl-ACP methyl ester carboxylesterase